MMIIITDLDGTLLHPETYSFDAALPALKLIKEKDIPLIFCSSKTKAEIEVWRKRLENTHPFISENGGGIFIPEGYFGFEIGYSEKPVLKGFNSGIKGYNIIELGDSYKKVRDIFIVIRNRLDINARGFGDMTAEEVSLLTNMPLSEAVLAKKREFDEPFIFSDGETRIKEFLNAIEGAGLKWTQGRFYHILGNNDKGLAVNALKEFYKKKYGEIATMGIGDSFNDLPFLREVDYPVIVQKEDGTYDERVNLPNLIKANGIGPEGWNKAVINLIM